MSICIRVEMFICDVYSFGHALGQFGFYARYLLSIHIVTVKDESTTYESSLCQGLESHE